MDSGWRRRGGLASGVRFVGMIRGNYGDMEDVVDSPRRWEFEFVRKWVDDCKGLEGTCEAGFEFVSRAAGEGRIGSGKKHFVVYFKPELAAVAIGMLALAILSDGHVGFGRVHSGGDVSDESAGGRNLGGCVSDAERVCWP
jgi:hypothetical protein